MSEERPPEVVAPLSETLFYAAGMLFFLGGVIAIGMWVAEVVPLQAQAVLMVIGPAGLIVGAIFLAASGIMSVGRRH